MLFCFAHEPDNEDIKNSAGHSKNWGRPSAPRKKRNPSVGPGCADGVAVMVRSATWSSKIAAGERKTKRDKKSAVT